MLGVPGKPQSQGKDGAPIAAGIVFVGPDGDVLLLRRSSDEKNYGGHWGLPGGGGEDGEDAYDAALRETREEVGFNLDDAQGLKVMDRVETPNGMVFTTFAKSVDEKFVPTLDHEHTGYCWASLDQLPRPLHPSVERCLGDHIGAAADMAPEAWSELRKNFAQWTREEQAEPEHGAHDAALALDEATVRTIDADGRMHVSMAHISKANVCPYWGHEIPGYEELKLDPDKQYQLFRSPEELRKAADTSNGLQLMIKHVPVSADDHKPFDTAGALGTDAIFNDPYLDNSLHIWSQEAIDGIEDESRRELSCGYHYVPVMTPGTYKGTPYDGVMTGIVFNHVALVPEGRAGADVLVSDSQIKPLNTETTMKKVLTRFAGASMLALDFALRPKLAKDAKIDLSAMFEGITKKNFKEKKAKLATDLKAATRGKLAADAKMDDLIGMLDSLESCDVAEGADEDPNSGLPMSKEDMDKKAKDEAEKEAKDAAECKKAEDKAARDSFRDKLESEDMKNAFDAMFGKEEAEDEESGEAEKSAEGKEGKEGKDAKLPKPGIDKKAMDAAIAKTANDTALRVKREMREVAQAYADVEPFVGKMALGMDSAADVYRSALKGLGMDAKKVDALHVDALKPILEAQPKPGAAKELTFDERLRGGGGTEGYASRWGASASRVQ